MTATKTVPLRLFIARLGVTATAEMVDRNPHMDGSDQMDNYRVLLRHGRKQMTVYFSMGLALGREPSAEDVLDCLASDASGVDNASSFEDWCGEYGYDTDSRKAERIFKVCERQAAKLRNFLGQDDYEALLWHTERL